MAKEETTFWSQLSFEDLIEVLKEKSWVILVSPSEILQLIFSLVLFLFLFFLSNTVIFFVIFFKQSKVNTYGSKP